MAVLIKGARYVVRAADRVESNCDVLIDGNRIAGIGRYEPQPGWDIIGATNCAVIPGLVNAHTHLYQNFLKGLNDGVSLVDWIAEVLFPAADVIHSDHWQAHDERLGYAWSLAGTLEMIKGGTTCCTNMDMTMDSVFGAWLDIGFRGVGAVTLSDQWIPEKLRRAPEVTQREALGYVQRWHGVPVDRPRISTALAPSTPYLASDELLAWTREQRDRLGLAVQIHVAETRYEMECVGRDQGTTPLRYLDRLGLVDSRLTAVHCVHVDEKDLDLLRDRGATVVYNPKSNMKLGSGTAPVIEMLRRGIPVALSNDGSASNDVLDMFEEMRCAALLQKVVSEDPRALSARDVFTMATENGARACGIDAGTIDPGRLADVAVVNLRKPHLVPVHDIVNSLVYCTKAEDVEVTIIDGQVVMRDRKLCTMDEEEILDLAQEWGSYLRERSLKSEFHQKGH
ncbi:MAG: amidohydrolase [Anaerolineae bacterium]|nr:amidohydrolase [Anaerolineae bacterium]